MHSSDPATPHLGVRARMEGYRTADLDDSLTAHRTLVRIHAMRRTLFVVPTGDLAVYQAAVADDIARKERRRLHGWLAGELPAAEIRRLVDDLEEKVLGALGESELRTQDLVTAVPGLGLPIVVGSGRWATRTPLSSRLLFVMAMDGRIVRTRPAGSWRSSQYRWAAARSWLGPPPAQLDARTARATLARRYVMAYGPATVVDLRWWAGWTLRATRDALADTSAVEVSLDDGSAGYLMPDDSAPSDPARAPTVAFLPALDPTPMGWKQRDWYVGPHAGDLFDRNGNIGPTVWVDGRIVGAWAQRADGQVVYRLLEQTGGAAVAEEAQRLTHWLDGVVVSVRFPTPLFKHLRDLPGG